MLIVEDTPQRQEILSNLFRDHAWILVHTVQRALRLLEHYDFDLILLDYDLAGEGKGDRVARGIVNSRNAEAKVIIHSMNAIGAQKTMNILPDAEFVPISKMTKSNAVFKRLRQEFAKGVDIDWSYVFSGSKQNENPKRKF